MSFESWLTLLGLLFLAMALSSVWVRRLPVSAAAIYMGVGCLIGPWGLTLVRIDITEHAAVFQRLTEVAIIFSLFIGGLRLRLGPTRRAWSAAYRLASVVMIVCISGLALAAYALLDVPAATALLIAAALAPTDPVLASGVAVGHSEDHDRMRYALSGEAGLNDGAAFPFVTLAFLLARGPFSSSNLMKWVGTDLLWAIPAGLLIGVVLGWVVGRLAISLRAKQRDTAAPTDFLALALIALSYVAALSIHAWGFLSVFAAGLGLRRAEVTTVSNDPHPDASPTAAQPHPPAETLVTASTVTEAEIQEPAVAAGVLVAEVFSFGDTAERIFEVLLVLTLGITLATHLDWRGIMLGGILMLVIRPAATLICLVGTPTSLVQRALIGWFGIRGIGTLYYVSVAIPVQPQQSVAHEVADICVSAVALSILVHGLTARPLMSWYERRRSTNVR
jgi:NhaP-type Na+/H+ or K+/H+ antiporter